MQFSSKREGWTSDNQSWLGSAHGTDVARTVTIDGTTLTGFDGVIPSGTPLKATTGGKYAPVDADADDLAGFLLTPQSFEGAGDVVAPLLDRGRIRVDNLPEGAFDVSTLTAANPLFVLIKKEA